MDDEKINQLSSMVTIDEIINYVKENQQSKEKVRVVRR